jgi:hypothetical protein
MPNNTPEAGFVSISNLVAEVLFAINDDEKRRYYARTLQNVLNKLRNVNVHYGRLYKEVPIDLSDDLKAGAYPQDLVKAISVGIYRNGEFWSFTRKSNMAKTVTGDGGAYDEDFKEAEDIPTRGVLFAARGKNLGYWVEDDENCQFFVRNYDETKVILRYRSNGITCTTENCVPYKLKDLIVAMVVYDFALSRIPNRFTGMELELKRMERSRHYDEFTDLEYIPQNMDEFMDAQFASSNIAPKRGL